MWLFGGGKKEEKKKVVNPEEAINKIGTQLSDLDKRQKVLEVKSTTLTQEALKQKKAKNNRAAILSLKKKKMNDSEMNKIDGMKLLLEQQKHQLESKHLSSNHIRCKHECGRFRNSSTGDCCNRRGTERRHCGKDG